MSGYSAETRTMPLLGEIGAKAVDDTGITVRMTGGLTIGTISSSGTTPPTITASGTPRVATYTSEHIDVEIQTGGTIGTATYRWSIDDGSTWSADILCSSSEVLPGTGVTLNFPAGTYNADNAYVVPIEHPWLIGTSVGANMISDEERWYTFVAESKSVYLAISTSATLTIDDTDRALHTEMCAVLPAGILIDWRLPQKAGAAPLYLHAKCASGETAVLRAWYSSPRGT